MKLEHRFVEHFPDVLDEATLYISVTFATATHLCCCGCGGEVVTPFGPEDWALMFDGETVSLDPSIGNWSFPCQSHYWIERSSVKWARRWSEREIAEGRRLGRLPRLDLADKEDDHGEGMAEGEARGPVDPPPSQDCEMWTRFRRWRS
jgi:hypothetical protein